MILTELFTVPVPFWLHQTCGRPSCVWHELSQKCSAGGEDGTALEMAFSRKKIEERKAWLRSFVPGTYLDHTANDITYTDFVNKVCA